MFIPRLFKISNIKRDIFFAKSKMLLTSSNFVILNQAFLCSASEHPVAVTDFQRINSVTNTYYRQYLLNNTEYKNLFFHENSKSNSKTADLLNQLELNKEDNSNIKNQLYNYLNRELNLFTFNELCEATFLIMKFIRQNGMDPSWEKILGSINEQCLIRMSSWTGDELIKMTNISMVHAQFLKFKNKLLYKLMKKSSTGHEIVFLFYFLIRRRVEVPKEYSFDLQSRTLEILPKINVIETGIIAEGYCHSFDGLQEPDLLYCILKKVIDEMETVEQTPFNTFCKFAKIMSSIYKSKGIREFQKHAIEAALRFGTKSIISLARCGENIKHLDSNLRTVLMNKVKDDIKQLSLFEIERVTYVNVLFNIHDEEFLKLALDMFEAKERTEKNKKSFILFLSHLMHYKIYPKNLLAFVMEQDLVNNLKCEEKKFTNAWWYIYCSLEIERPDSITVNLTSKIRNKIYKVYKFTNAVSYQMYEPYLRRIKKILQNSFKDGMIEIFQPLPHYPPGLLMRFDKNSKLQMLPEEFSNFNKSHVVKPLKDGNIWMFIAFVCHLYLANVTDNEPNLIFQTQVRQLNALGYTVFPVFRNQMKTISVNNEQLENLIYAKLEECNKNQKNAVTN